MPSNDIRARLLIDDLKDTRTRQLKGAADFKETTMTVRTILDTKGHHILSVEPEATLSAAVKILGERKIGALLVMSNGCVEGILSERDIVRVVGERGASVLDSPVS